MEPVARSYLLVPGNRPDRFAKACASGAHAVIIDLEDAVGFAEKNAARKAVAQWLDPAHAVVLRINAVNTAWFRDDLALCGTPGVAAVMLPKAEAADHVRLVAERIGGHVPILPIIESAKGFEKSAEIAQAEKVKRLVFGTLDFQIDLGIDGDAEETVYFRSHLVLVSRLAGIQPPVDGVWAGLDDPEQLRVHTVRGRSLGFGGKLCIHPKQIPHVNECFRPSQNEVAWAKRVLDAVFLSKGSVVAVDGQMVDRPVILKAEEILNESNRQGSP